MKYIKILTGLEDKRGLILKKRFFKNQVFIRFLLSYLLILAFPLLVSWLAYSRAIRDAESYTKDSMSFMLKQSSNIMDRHLGELNRVAIQAVQLSLKQSLGELLTRSSLDNFELSRLLDEFSSYFLTSNFAFRWGIYFKDSPSIFYADTIYEARFFYENVFTYFDWDYDQWREKLFAKFYNGEYLPASRARVERVDQSLITYIQSIPASMQNQRPEGVIFFVIDERELFGVMPEVGGSGGCLYVMDGSGQVIASQGQGFRIMGMELEKGNGYLETTYLGEPVFVTYTTSENTGWTYVVALPRTAVMSKVQSIKGLALTVTFISLFCGCGLAYVLARKNAEPIRGIVKMLSEFLGIEKGHEVGEYEFLQGKVHELIANNTSLRQDLAKQGELASATFFDRLLRGDFKRSDEAEIFSRYVGLTTKGCEYLAVILKMYDSGDLVNKSVLKELDMTKVLVKDVLRHILDQDVFIHDLDENHLVILMIFPDEPERRRHKADVEEVIQRIYREIYERYRLRLNFAAGNFCDDFLRISQSFDQAKDAIAYIGRGNDNWLLWYADIPKQGEGYYYSMELENRLMNAAKAGDLAEVKRHLRLVWEENFEKRALSSEMVHLLAWEIRGTLVKLKYQLEPGVQFDEAIDNLMATTQMLGGFFERIEEIYENICDFVDNQKRSHNIQLKNKMIEFIDQAYQEPSLSLSSVASKFGMTESYISQFFKEQAGENFSSYLEKIRMSHACELLSQSELSIGEIALQSGYYSDQVFRRAFKRYHGMTPNEFRLIHRAKDLEGL